MIDRWRRQERVDILLTLTVGVLFLAFWFCSAIAIASRSCIAKTLDIGFDHRWSLMGGCQIEVNPGQWIPLESYYFKQE